MRRMSQTASWLALALIGTLLLSAGALAQQRRGAWVDEVIMSEEANAATAITRLEVGEIDLYAFAVSDPGLFQQVQANPRLAYSLTYGSFNEMTFNVAGPVFSGSGKLNPFAVARVREAMNWLIDREYIAQEIFGGMGAPRYTVFNTVFPDFARVADVARAIELKYGHDPERAEAVISEEMQELGAVKVNGVWHYNGEPVEIIVLIRVEDERREVGDYLASLLEDLGFVVDRQYKTAGEASAIWISSDPNEGLFHIYTGGWVSTAVDRDLGDNFDFYYNPRGLPYPLWQAYQPTPRFDEISDRLARNDFRSIEERRELIAEALSLSMEDSVRIFYVDRSSFIPRRAELEVTSDLAGGISGTLLWPHTLRFEGRTGGIVNVALPSLLTEPWNPIAGTNWVFDQMPIRGTADSGTIANPYTGLPMPQRIERAEVTVKEGLPVTQNADWVELHFAPEIPVPADAWADWDPVAQRFITVAERFPGGTTALRKSVVYYPEDLYSTVFWHDGSPFSVGDIVMGIILSFDRGKPGSPIFDEVEQPVIEAFLRSFKGVRIVSVDPLVIETYSDTYFLDAELNVSTWFPLYAQGPGAWHNLALGVRAESQEELAFSTAKADQLDVEWMNYVAGPSLGILARHLNEARASNYIPYEPTLGQYVSAEEAQARWSNLAAWYQEKGHFWIGTGPLYLERAYPVEKIVHLKRFERYPDPADKWALFAEPMIAEVDVFGSRRVQLGSPATFEVEVSFAGEPYPDDAIAEVKYLVIDARGEIAFTGWAEPLEDGLYRVTLSADDTAKLTVGVNRLEVVTVSTLVSIPTFESFEFVTTR